MTPAGRGAFWLAVARRMPGGWPWSRFALLARRASRRHLRASGALPVDTRVWGLKLRLFPGRSVSEARILFLPASWDRPERTRLRAWIESRPTDRFTFVDVGANVGGYSFWVMSVAGRAARVVAVEPSPEVARQLRYNVAANEADGRMRVVEAAVGGARGEGRLTVDAPNSGENRLVGVGGAGPETGRRTARVEVVPLADLVRDAGLDRIDCLKVDVEGGEAAVIQPFLRTAPRSLWPARMIVELKGSAAAASRSAGDADAESLGAWIESQGYRLVLRTRLNGLFELGGR